LHAAGMPSLDIIRAVTTNAAEMLGWQDRVGGVEPREICGSRRRCRGSGRRHCRTGTNSIRNEGWQSGAE